MNIVVTSATNLEVEILKTLVSKYALPNIHFHCSGVGMLASCFAIQKMITDLHPQCIVQVGIAGSFDDSCVLGDVVLIENEFLGSCGVTENGQWYDLFDLNLGNMNAVPFAGKALHNPHLSLVKELNMPKVNAITVDEITTDRKRQALLQQKYNCAVEGMEGASLHYCGLLHQIPFLQIRGISNLVGERNKANWRLKNAIENVNLKAFELLKTLLKS